MQHAYQGITVAFATMHGKQRAIGKPFTAQLGASVIVPNGIDTDLFGTFTGEWPRSGTMLDAARAKARLAMEVTGLPYGLGSEGSFGPHPAIPLISGGTELLLFLDGISGRELHESMVTHRTNYRSLICKPNDCIDSFLTGVGFPRHALVVSAHLPHETVTPMKGIKTRETLQSAMAEIAQASSDGLVMVTTDMRAHHNPTRMATIRKIAQRLARRLAAPCPSCTSPGFGFAEVVRGLPCSWCGEPTELAVAKVLRCAVCQFEVRQPIRRNASAADPGHCTHCNP